MSKMLTLEFGAIVPPLFEQIFNAGIVLSKDAAEKIHYLQLDADAITRLAVRGFLRDSEKTRLHEVLMRKIVQTLEPGNQNPIRPRGRK